MVERIEKNFVQIIKRLIWTQFSKRSLYQNFILKFLCFEWYLVFWHFFSLFFSNSPRSTFLLLFEKILLRKIYYKTAGVTWAYICTDMPLRHECTCRNTYLYVYIYKVEKWKRVREGKRILNTFKCIKCCSNIFFDMHLKYIMRWSLGMNGDCTRFDLFTELILRRS